MKGSAVAAMNVDVGGGQARSSQRHFPLFLFGLSHVDIGDVYDPVKRSNFAEKVGYFMVSAHYLNLHRDFSIKLLC